MTTRNCIGAITIALLVGLVGTATHASARQDRPSGDIRGVAGGTLRGTVTDVDEQPIPGAHIVVVGTRIGTTANRDGDFMLTLDPGTYQIVCRAIGFHESEHTVQIRLQETALLSCVLPEAVVEAGEVVVVGARRPQLAREVPASLEVLQGEDLESRNVVALDDALTLVSGVQVQGNQITIRGSSGFSYNTGSRVLLLIDGMPVLSPDSDGIPIDGIPPSRIDQIEVLKGPGSALYGSGALGGVVNVVTKPVPDDRELAIRTYAGAYEPTRHSEWAARWRAASDWRPFVGATLAYSARTGQRSGGWLSVDYRDDPGYRRLSGIRQGQLFGKYRVGIRSSSDLDILGSFLTRRRDSFLFWNGLDDALNPGSIQLSGSTTPSGSNDNQTSQILLQPRLTARLASSVVTATLRGFATVIQPISSDGSVKPVSDGTLGVRFGGEGQWQRFVGNSSQIVVGAALDANATRSSFYQTDDGGSAGQQPEAAVYVQWEGRPTPRVAVVAGGRFDWFRISSSQTASRLSPKVSASIELRPNFTLRTSAGLGFRVPSLAERYTDDQSFFPIFRNPTLKPEKSASLEAGGRGWFRAGPATIRWDVAAFAYRLDDLIEPRFVRANLDDGSAALGFQFINVPSGRVGGLESTLSVESEEGVQLRLGYTYLASEDRATGLELPFRSRHLVVATSEYGLAIPRVGRLSLGLDFRFASRPNELDADFARFVPDADVLVDTRVFDVFVGWAARRTNIRLGVKNALDYYYLERPALLAPPRNIRLQVSAIL